MAKLNKSEQKVTQMNWTEISEIEFEFHGKIIEAECECERREQSKTTKTFENNTKMKHKN